MEFLVKRISCLSAVLFVAALLWTPESHAQKLSFIRDAEIENTIRSYSTPLFEAAGLDPSSIDIYLVNDKSLNAFVAGGQNMFLNTGLLLRAGNVGQAIGVIAHETAHYWQDRSCRMSPVKRAEKMAKEFGRVFHLR